MTPKTPKLSDRQARLLKHLVEGLTPSEAAREMGYTTHHVHKIARSYQGQAELDRLRAESEEILAKALPDLLKQSLAILNAGLNHPVLTIRIDVAKFIIRHMGRPLIEKIAENQELEGMVIDNRPTEFLTTAKEGANASFTAQHN